MLYIVSFHCSAGSNENGQPAFAADWPEYGKKPLACLTENLSK